MNILRITSLPLDIDQLKSEAASQGHGNLGTLIEEFENGANTFTEPGECLLLATESGQSVGIVGLNIDPYTNSDSIGRIRRLFVASHYRRRGLATALVREIESIAKPHFNKLQLFTTSPEASMFYIALGYEKVDGHPKVTHVKALSD